MKEMELKTIIGKGVLLEKLRENRERYVETRRVLVEVYKKKSEEYQVAYTEYSKNVYEGTLTESEDAPYPPSIPEDRTETYDIYIEMIERHCGDTLEIESASFSRLFMDKWNFIREHVQALTRMASGYPMVAAALTAY